MWTPLGHLQLPLLRRLFITSVGSIAQTSGITPQLLRIISQLMGLKFLGSMIRICELECNKAHVFRIYLMGKEFFVDFWCTCVSTSACVAIIFFALCYFASERWSMIITVLTSSRYTSYPLCLLKEYLQFFCIILWIYFHS